ncbi:MAG: glycosyltransferase family protein [Candidatus Riflebacteria bacterium]|nr:glycosyltransferase family protein [Candidatus Riflebacteria bacterium]
MQFASGKAPVVDTQVIIQARMGSARLPGKVLLELAGRPVIAHVVRRAAAASRVNRVVVATTTMAEDDLIVAWAINAGIPVTRGSSNDVLDRYNQAATEWPCRRIVRITADCPLADPGIIDAVIAAHATDAFDYVSNLHPPTLPIGLDAEVFSRELLGRIASEAVFASHREHVTLYVRENRDRFRFGNVSFGRDCSRNARLTLDRPEDLHFFRAFFEKLADSDSMPSIYEVLHLLEVNSSLITINSGIDRFEGARKSAMSENRTLNL